MLFSGVSNATYAADNAYVMVPSCPVYQTADFSSPLLYNDEPVTLANNSEVVELVVEGDFAKITFNYLDTELEGYVYKYYLSFSKSEQEMYPVFNGSVAHEGAVIYDLQETPTTHTAKAGQGIYLYKGYQHHEKYNAVAIVLEDGSLYYGLMLTSDISPNGINAGLITGIMVIASCLTIIFLLVFIKKKKGGSKG